MTDEEKKDRDNVLRIKKRQVEEIQAVFNNVNDTRVILDGILDKMDSFNQEFVSAELILRFTGKEKEEII